MRNNFVPTAVTSASVADAFLPLLRRASGKGIWLAAPSLEAAGPAAHAASCAALKMYVVSKKTQRQIQADCEGIERDWY